MTGRIDGLDTQLYRDAESSEEWLVQPYVTDSERLPHHELDAGGLVEENYRGTELQAMVDALAHWSFTRSSEKLIIGLIQGRRPSLFRYCDEYSNTPIGIEHTMPARRTNTTKTLNVQESPRRLYVYDAVIHSSVAADTLSCSLLTAS